MAVTLGKNITIGGVNNARSITVNNSANEIDCTKFGDTAMKYRKSLVEQTVEIECVDDPGVTIGNTFGLTGAGVGNVTYIVTNISRADPIDDIQTFTVSGTRAIQS